MKYLCGMNNIKHIIIYVLLSYSTYVGAQTNLYSIGTSSLPLISAFNVTSSFNTFVNLPLVSTTSYSGTAIRFSYTENVNGCCIG